MLPGLREELERGAIVADLAYHRRVDRKHIGGGAAGLLQQVRDLHAAERHFAEARDRGLGLGLALELFLDQLLVGDVEHDPVPEERPVGRVDEHGAVADPDHMPVLVEHAVVQIERARVVLVPGRHGCLGGTHLGGLVVERGLAILGMKLTRPEVLVAGPLLDGEAEDRFDPLVDVMPDAVGTGCGNENDRRNCLDDCLVVNPCLRLVSAHLHAVIGSEAKLYRPGRALAY